MSSMTFAAADLHPYTVWQCPSCGGRVQNQAAEPAERLLFCQVAFDGFKRLCGYRMVRVLVVGAVLAPLCAIDEATP